MKKIIALLFLFSLGAQAESFPVRLLDKNGFVKCIGNEKHSLVFDWDPFIRTAIRKINYFELSEYVQSTSHLIKNCSEIRYMNAVPVEILKSVESIVSILPEDILSSVQQIAAGAHVFRAEKTPDEYVRNRLQIFKIDSPEVLSLMRYEVGDSFAEKVLTYWNDNFISKNKSCEEFIGTCDFYLCQEQKNPCGLDGYNLSFGYKYCSASKFSLLQKMQSPAGKSWVRDVFTCLQTKSFANSEQLNVSQNKCLVIKETSYDSHPDCYFQAGFRELKLSEKEKIFSLVKKEIFSSETLKQGVKLLGLCGNKDKE